MEKKKQPSTKNTDKKTVNEPSTSPLQGPSSRILRSSIQQKKGVGNIATGNVAKSKLASSDMKYVILERVVSDILTLNASNVPTENKKPLKSKNSKLKSLEDPVNTVSMESTSTSVHCKRKANKKHLNMTESLPKIFSVGIEKASSFQKPTVKKSKQSFKEAILAVDVSLGRTKTRSRSKLEIKTSKESAIIKRKQNPKNGERVARKNDFGECVDNDQILYRSNATEKEVIEGLSDGNNRDEYFQHSRIFPDRTISSASIGPLLPLDNISSKTPKVEVSADVTRNNKRVKILLPQSQSFLELDDSRKPNRKMSKNSPITNCTRSNTDELQDLKENDIPRIENLIRTPEKKRQDQYSSLDTFSSTDADKCSQLQFCSPEHNENKSQELHNSGPSPNSRKYKNEPIFNLLTNPSVWEYSMKNLCTLSSQEMSCPKINEQRENVCKDNKNKVEKLDNIAEKKGEAEPLKSASQTKSILVSKLIKNDSEESKEMVDELLNRRLQSGNEGKNDNLKAKQMSLVNFIPKFEEKRVAYDKHSVLIKSLPIEDLEGHFNEITTDLTAIYLEKIQCIRHNLYFKDRAALKNLHVAMPFTSKQSQRLIAHLYKFLFPEIENCVQYATYVAYVMLPETFIRIYSRVTGLDYEGAQQELRFGPYYD